MSTRTFPALRRVRTVSIALLTVVVPCTISVAAPLNALQVAVARPIADSLKVEKNTPVSPPPETDVQAQALKLPAVFVRGDSDRNGVVDMTDSLYTLSSLFLGTKDLHCADAADANDNGEVEMTDAVLVLRYLFAGGNVVSAPFPACGMDLTDDALECDGVETCATEESTSRALMSVAGGHIAELPPEILEAIPEGATVRLRRVEGSTTRVITGVATRFGEEALLIESRPQTVASRQAAAAVANVRMGAALRVDAGLALSPGTLQFECSPLLCICDGDADCNDMFTNGPCGDGICWEDDSGRVVCICLR